MLPRGRIEDQAVLARLAMVEHGMVDVITPRAEMKPTIARFLRIFLNKS